MSKQRVSAAVIEVLLQEANVEELSRSLAWLYNSPGAANAAPMASLAILMQDVEDLVADSEEDL